MRSIDGTRLVEKTDITSYKESGDSITAGITVKDLIEQDVEYNWILLVTVQGETLRYYTRIIDSRQPLINSIQNPELKKTVEDALIHSVNYLAKFVQLAIKENPTVWNKVKDTNPLWSYGNMFYGTKTLSDLYVNINYMLRLSLLKYSKGYKGTPSLNEQIVQQLSTLPSILGILFDAYDEDVIRRNI